MYSPLRFIRPLIFAMFLAGCATSPPANVTPVADFQVDRYLGTWYEIARLDHRFERGMTDVTATYSRNADGSINVLNCGYDVDKGRWDSAEGTAKFRSREDVASLKVSFFRPFYGGYHVIELDDKYEYALVAGPSRDYLWILARSPELSQDTVHMLVDKAHDLGFLTNDLIYVTHERSAS